jgi:(E)-4-hydroxy-3-methylbut-2-enyl-diphosphate synthase
MAYQRRKTRPVWVGDVQIGGDAPIVVQSMTTTDTRDPEATLRQIHELADVGCEIVRVAVPDRIAAAALADIVPRSPIPVVADIHFEHTLALKALEAGVHKLRLNPGISASRRKCARSCRKRRSAVSPFASASTSAPSRR